MFKNNVTPPPQKKGISQMFKPNATMITRTADDATLDLISCIHNFPSQNPF